MECGEGCWWSGGGRATGGVVGEGYWWIEEYWGGVEERDNGVEVNGTRLGLRLVVNIACAPL